MNRSTSSSSWTGQIKWNQDGLIPVVIQHSDNGMVLMHAWMNEEALQRSLKEKQTVLWSRSRQCLWKKGETSGHTQSIKAIWLDCDADTLLIKVMPKGGIACHTGRQSCFFQALATDSSDSPLQQTGHDPDKDTP